MREIIESFKCPIGRVRLSKMAPHTKINAHRDVEDEVASVAINQVRLHIPITTSDKVVSFIGKEPFQLAHGRLYYADFAKEHSVRNDGDATRVHLILELKMNDWLRGIFPEFTLVERLHMALQRNLHSDVLEGPKVLAVQQARQDRQGYIRGVRRADIRQAGARPESRQEDQ
jgi:hypothetical protein